MQTKSKVQSVAGWRGSSSISKLWRPPAKHREPHAPMHAHLTHAHFYHVQNLFIAVLLLYQSALKQLFSTCITPRCKIARDVSIDGEIKFWCLVFSGRCRRMRCFSATRRRRSRGRTRTPASERSPRSSRPCGTTSTLRKKRSVACFLFSSMPNPHKRVWGVRGLRSQCFFDGDLCDFILISLLLSKHSWFLPFHFIQALNSWTMNFASESLCNRNKFCELGQIRNWTPWVCSLSHRTFGFKIHALCQRMRGLNIQNSFSLSLHLLPSLFCTPQGRRA